MPRTKTPKRKAEKPAPPPRVKTLTERVLIRVRELLYIAAPTDSGIPRNEVRFLLTCEKYLIRRLAGKHGRK